MPITTQNSTQTLIELLSHLVRMPTVSSDKATNTAALDWVQEQLHGLPLDIKRYTKNGFPSLIATTNGVTDPKKPKLWLAGHIDVVPGSPKSFDVQHQGEYIVGRGVRDMKFAIASYILLFQQLGERLNDYDLGLMITGDEENGGLDGVGWLLNEQDYRGHAVLLPDGGDNWLLESKAKGLMHLEISSEGKAAHGSRPWLGKSAVWELMDFLEEVREHFTQEPCGNDSHMHDTMNVGQINGGQAVNQLAASATASVDIRIAPGSTVDLMLGYLNTARINHPGVSFKPRFTHESYSQPQDGAAAIWREISEDITGLDLTETTYAHAGSDGRLFWDHGIPCIITYPRGDGQHSENERILVADLDRFHEVCTRFIDEWAKN